MSIPFSYLIQSAFFFSFVIFLTLFSPLSPPGQCGYATAAWGQGIEGTQKYYETGRAHYQKGSYEEAAQAFEKAIAADPNHAQAYHWLGASHFMLGRYERAIQALGKVPESNPHIIHVYLLLGRAYHALKKYGEALAPFKKYVELAPNDHAGHTWIGMTYHQLGRYEEAKKELGAAQGLDPSQRGPYFWLGSTHYKLGNYSEAVRMLLKCIQLSSKPAGRDSAGAYLILGDSYAQLGDMERAKEAYRNYSQMTYLASFEGEGFSLHERGNHAQAAEWYKRAMVMEPRDPKLHYNLGMVLILANQYSDAIHVLQRAVSLFPDDRRLYLPLATAYHKQKNYSSAVVYAGKAAQLNPRDAAAMRILGEAHYNKEDYAEAIEAYERRNDLKPGDLDLYEVTALGVCYGVIGDYERSAKIFAEGLSKFPHDKNLFEWYLISSYYGGGWEAAKQSWLRRHQGLTDRDEERLRDLINRGVTDFAVRAERKRMAYLSLRHYSLLFGFIYKRIRGLYRNEEQAILQKIFGAYKKLPFKPAVPPMALEFAKKAEWHGQREEWDRAEHYYSQSIAIAPWWPDAHYNMALILYARANALPGAVKEMKIYVDLEPSGPYGARARQLLKNWEGMIQEEIRRGGRVQEGNPWIITPDRED